MFGKNEKSNKGDFYVLKFNSSTNQVEMILEQSKNEIEIDKDKTDSDFLIELNYDENQKKLNTDILNSNFTDSNLCDNKSNNLLLQKPQIQTISTNCEALKLNFANNFTVEPFSNPNIGIQVTPINTLQSDSNQHQSIKLSNKFNTILPDFEAKNTYTETMPFQTVPFSFNKFATWQLSLNQLTLNKTCTQKLVNFLNSKLLCSSSSLFVSFLFSNIFKINQIKNESELIVFFVSFWGNLKILKRMSKRNSNSRLKSFFSFYCSVIKLIFKTLTTSWKDIQFFFKTYDQLVLLSQVNKRLIFHSGLWNLAKSVFRNESITCRNDFVTIVIQAVEINSVFVVDSETLDDCVNY